MTKRKVDYLGRVENWPTMDQRRWQEAGDTDDIFDQAGGRSRWRPATTTAVIHGYGNWLAWLRDAGLLDPEMVPEDRLTEGLLRQYVRHMQSRVRPATVRHRILHLERALSVLAPSYDRTMIRGLINRLSKKVDISRKRVRLQEPGTLVELGMVLMANAEAGIRDCPRRDAVVFRDGLQLALLAMRPLRARNFSSLRIGTHLIETPNGWRIEIPGDETKTHTALSFTFPQELVPALERYLFHHRPILCSTRYTGDHLWVSFHYKAQGPGGLHIQITNATRAAFGKPVNPHLARDCAATSIAINDPQNIRAASAVLGHRTFSATERHYNLSRTIDASRTYLSAIKAVRRRGR